MKTDNIKLTFDQIAAIHATAYEIDNHQKITIEQSKNKYKHIYIKIGKEDMFHISKKGKATRVWESCEGKKCM